MALGHPVFADRFGTSIPMRDKGAATYYVDSYLQGLGPTEMMVDTGSGYLTINEVALNAISAQGKAHYVKQLKGVLANGQEMVVPVYRLDAVRLGEECWIHDVQAAVFPGRTRFILGLSALSKASPFIFEVDPPRLVLSNCGKTLLKSSEAQKAPDAPPPAGGETKQVGAIAKN
jgi:predicted aspartyl protease